MASISFPDMVLSLPSTASSRIYPDNTPSKFKVKLAKEIYLLESEWEVALSSISFPSTSDTDSQECELSEVSRRGFLMWYGT